eukprot:2016090-Pyramimonas_sp.AAC.1
MERGAEVAFVFEVLDADVALDFFAVDSKVARAADVQNANMVLHSVVVDSATTPNKYECWISACSAFSLVDRVVVFAVAHHEGTERHVDCQHYGSSSTALPTSAELSTST